MTWGVSAIKNTSALTNELSQKDADKEDAPWEADLQHLYEIIGTNIKRFRKRSKMSQFELSEQADISPQFVVSLESGKSGCSLETIVKLAHVLGVLPYEFFIMLPKDNPVRANIVHMLERFLRESLRRDRARDACFEDSGGEVT